MSVTCDVIDVLFVSDVVFSPVDARRRTPICWLAGSPPPGDVVTVLLMIETDGKVIVGSTLFTSGSHFRTVPGLTPTLVHAAMACGEAATDSNNANDVAIGSATRGFTRRRGLYARQNIPSPIERMWPSFFEFSVSFGWCWSPVPDPVPGTPSARLFERNPTHTHHSPRNHKCYNVALHCFSRDWLARGGFGSPAFCPRLLHICPSSTGMIARQFAGTGHMLRADRRISRESNKLWSWRRP